MVFFVFIPQVKYKLSGGENKVDPKSPPEDPQEEVVGHEGEGWGQGGL